MRVSRWKISVWLAYLKANHPDYKDINIDPANLADLPEGGSIGHRLLAIRETPLSEEEALAEEVAARKKIDLSEPHQLEEMIVPDPNISATEVAYMEAALDKHRQGVTHLPIPSWRNTPINEFQRGHRLFQMAFPTLFPNGKGDWYDSRDRYVTLAQYATHMMRYHDGRFGQHPRFRFMIFNTLMRHNANETSKFLVSRNVEVGNLSVAELSEKFKNEPGFTNKICRYGSKFKGTRPFWQKERFELEATARHIQYSPAFLTFSVADMQWDDLHRFMPDSEVYQKANDNMKRRIRRENMINNPHIIAEYIMIRFKIFRECILERVFDIADYWFRMEWQS
jgi:hypothetical protein